MTVVLCVCTCLMQAADGGRIEKKASHDVDSSGVRVKVVALLWFRSHQSIVLCVCVFELKAE